MFYSIFCFRRMCKECGRKGFVIFPYTVVNNFDKLSIGTNVSIHEFCYDALYAITIGSNVAIAHGCSIVGIDHDAHNKCRSFKDAQTIGSFIEIGNNCWLGAGSRILNGGSMSDNCILAANAILRQKTKTWSLYAGIPAKLKKIPII